MQLFLLVFISSHSQLFKIFTFAPAVLHIYDVFISNFKLCAIVNPRSLIQVVDSSLDHSIFLSHLFIQVLCLQSHIYLNFQGLVIIWFLRYHSDTTFRSDCISSVFLEVSQHKIVFRLQQSYKQFTLN